MSAYRRFSSKTASATELLLVPVVEEDDIGLDPAFLDSILGCLGTTTMARFRTLFERLTMKISHRNGSPTYTSAAAVNVTVIPMSWNVLKLPVASSVEFFADEFTESGGWGILIELPVGVWRLTGRLLRCKDCPDLPKIGLTAAEKSMLVLHRISIRGRQTEERSTTAFMVTSSALGLVVSEIVSAKLLFNSSRYRNAVLSRGRQSIGNLKIRPLTMSSAMPSVSCNLTVSRTTTLWAKAGISISSSAIAIDLLLIAFDLWYFIRALSAGTARNPFLDTILRGNISGRTGGTVGCARNRRCADSRGVAPLSAGSS